MGEAPPSFGETRAGSARTGVAATVRFNPRDAGNGRSIESYRLRLLDIVEVNTPPI
jgi:hypothetical protein